MRSLRNAIVIGTALFGVTSIASAQGATPIPAQYMPPAGMCRVWLNGVFPAQQPAPTSCPEARANLRPNSRLIYGPSLRGVPNGQGPVMTNGRIGQGGQSVCTDANRDGICDYRQQGNGGNGQWDNRSDKDRRKAERKERKQREKEWKRDHKRGHGDGDNDDHDDDDDRSDRGRNSRGDRNGNNGTYGRGTTNTIPGVGRVSFP